MDSGEQQDSEAGSHDSEGWAGDEEGEVGEAPRPPRGHQRRHAVRPITDLHQLEPQRLCTYGCGAIVWPEEGGICCGMGKHILGPEFNPPIDPEYRELLDMDYISRDSRLLNAHLAMATQSVTPSRKDGGLTWHEQGGYSHLALFGKTYCVMHGMGGNNALDSFLLPEDLLLDGAQADMGPDYAQRLLRVRKYIADKHPLARHLCSIGDLPGEEIDLNPFIRLEAHSPRINAMELAMVSSGVLGEGDRANRVLLFDMRRHAKGLPPQFVNQRSALYDLLMFPLIHEKGVGGYFFSKDGECVKSTTGKKMFLQQYARAMIFQNERLHHLGRLGQEYALVQHSRDVEERLQFQRGAYMQKKFKRRRKDMAPQPGQEPAGSRMVGLTASGCHCHALLDDARSYLRWRTYL